MTGHKKLCPLCLNN